MLHKYFCLVWKLFSSAGNEIWYLLNDYSSYPFPTSACQPTVDFCLQEFAYCVCFTAMESYSAGWFPQAHFIWQKCLWKPIQIILCTCALFQFWLIIIPWIDIPCAGYHPFHDRCLGFYLWAAAKRVIMNMLGRGLDLFEHQFSVLQWE